MRRSDLWDRQQLTTEQRVAQLADDIDEHHDQADARFAALHRRFDRLEDKMTAAVVELEAKMDARLTSISSRTTGAVIGILSAIIVSLAVALMTVGR